MSTLATPFDLADDSAIDPIATIRDEPLNLERLEQYALNLAHTLKVVSDGRRDDSILQRARKNANVLRNTHKVLADAIGKGEPSSIDVEWLLDNFSVVEDQLREIHEDLPSAYFHELPKTERGLPRVYEIALGIVAHTDSAPDEQTLERFLNAFQQVSPLSIGETWAFPIMLRLALIENLRRIGEQILARRKCRHEARELVEQSMQGKSIELELDSLDRCAPTVVEVLQRFEDEPGISTVGRNDLEQRLRDRGWDLTEILREAHRRQAANQVTIGNLITSMRLISALDWMALFEQVNFAEKALREDPAEVYPAMDAASRDRYRRELERIAKRSGKSDIFAAECAINAARLARKENAAFVQQHVGYYLIGEGREAFRKSLGYRAKLTEWCVELILRYPMAFYLGGISLLMGICLAMLALSVQWAGASAAIVVALVALGLVPASELAISIVNWLVTLWAPPRQLAKLDFRGGIPESRKTLVVVPALLTIAGEIDSLVQRLESHYLSNPHSSLRFALLTDWADSAHELDQKDTELLEYATGAIRTLNRRYGGEGQGPFLLLHRKRLWNESERCWMGWERKRGKLMELHRWLRGEDTSFDRIEGNEEAIRPKGDQAGIEYIITLDADTQLPAGTAARLVGAISHPLNRPQVTPRGVTSGYVLLQPRVGVTLSSANQTWFSRIFANSPGIDPYSTAASDVYQDLFGEGSFTGKGIYDLQAFESCLADAFPENRILSHDLIEGCHARVGLLNDVEVIDGFPTRYEADARRQHRWARGDWQLLPWLLPYSPSKLGWVANHLSWLSRWKITDNLRRSLVPASVLALLIVGWLTSSGVAIALALSVVFFPLLVRVLVTIERRPRGDGATEIRYAWRWEILRAALQVFLQIVFLPHRALYLVDAIVRTLYRLVISRRRLLEWESAAVTEARINSRNSRITPSLLWCSPLLGVALPIVLPLESLLIAAPMLVAWFCAPLVVIWLDRRAAKAPDAMDPQQRASLRQIARRTWFYFDEFVNAQSSWLPPDNVQEYPVRKIALRVSPTNEGLFLVSGLCACDFGFINLSDLTTLWEKNLESWEKLQGLHGHPFNWYDAQTLEPLRPRYVSTVDSGNLAVCFLTLRAGIDDLLDSPLFGAAQWSGLLDTLAVTRQIIEEVYGSVEKGRHHSAEEILKQIALIESHVEAPTSATHWRERLTELRSVANAIASRSEGLSNRRARSEADVPVFIRGALRQIEGLSRDFDVFLGWWAHLAAGADPSDSASTSRWKTTPPDPHAVAFERSTTWRELIQQLESTQSLTQIATLDVDTESLRSALRKEWGIQNGQDTAKSWFDEFEASLRESAAAAQSLKNRLLQIATQAEANALRMEFGFLFNARRRLFSIGFNVDEGRLDQSHYDMLASEARLATYFAIVKGDTEYRSWFHMGRGLTEAAGHAGLVSWGGTMFEYMMPQIFHKSYDGSLIGESCKMAVARQREYGRQCNVPWGISESAFSAMASNHDYHYRSFGAPGIGLKRGLGKDLVVSPYSTMLAMELAPQPAFKNLTELIQVGALGPFGFFDAVDYTKSRMPKGKQLIVVRCYMAHHHGMSLLAIANLLLSGSVRRRFHHHPLGKAGELLLQERLPDVAPLVDATDSEHEIVENPRTESEVVSRKITGERTSVPKTHFLTNGRYSLMLTSSGSGYSTADNAAVTRWRRDATHEQFGQFIYVRDIESGQFWSAAYEPTRVTPAAYEAIFSIDKVEFRRRDRHIESHLDVTISPDHLAEIRRLKIINHSDEPKELEVTSYAEVALGSHAADLAHPAFQKLFIETEILHEQGAILARRRPRSASECAKFAFHVLAPSPHGLGNIEFETSREHFLGRGRGPDAPAALLATSALSGSAGAVLDPIFAIRQRITIPPRERVELSFTTGVAASREEAISLVDQCRDGRHVTRAFEMAWAFQQAELRQSHITPAKAHQYQRWAGPLIYPSSAWRTPAKVLHANQLGQTALWRYAVSGDLPILVARFSKNEHLDSVRELLVAHLFWRRAGFVVDLVFINDYPGSYLDAVHEQFIALVGEVHHQSGETPPNIVLVRASQAAPEDIQWLEAAASVVIRCDQPDWESKLGATPAIPRSWPLGMLQNANSHMPINGRSGAVTTKRNDSGLELGESAADRHHAASRSRVSPHTTTAAEKSDLQFANPWGGFSRDGSEYRMNFRSNQRPPKPWSNVLANAQLGTLITESGGGYSWLGNSREFKLSTWANDPTTDSPSEWLYLRDAETGEIFHPLPQNVDGGEVYHVTHSAGFSRFEVDTGRLHIETTQFVADTDPVKFVRIRVANGSNQERELSLTYFVEWVLGVNRDVTQLHVRSTCDQQLGVLLARNSYISDFANQLVFLTAVGGKNEFTVGREAFLGRQRKPAFPQALVQNQNATTTDDGGDPGGAVTCRFRVAPNGQIEIVFLLGGGPSRDAIAALLKKYGSPGHCNDALEQVIGARREELEILSIRTPSPATDILMNRWLPNQVLACRYFGRSALYQSGGAYGFRDQLQDIMAVVYSRPDLAREHLLRAASRQYLEGDVQHWWHPPVGRGTRTRFADDYLWLPLVTAHYLKVTGDTSVLDERASFLTSHLLEPHEQERYEHPADSGVEGTLYEHCLKTLGRAFRLGRHGLPLMGCGDWNDGMNKVGEEGKGESIWMGWFLLVLLDDFLPIMRTRGDIKQADALFVQAQQLRAQLEKEGWDGSWYRRAYFDDGTSLGSAQNDECQIDSIAQSWAVFANAQEDRCRIAMGHVWERLVRNDEGLVLLFAPPFQSSALDPGYIKGYLAGIRENGGQYTHAALWVAQAFALLGEQDRAWEILEMINPIHHSASRERIEQYQVEPYVVAADVYGVPPNLGRGGWTWYTGSAAWMYRIILETILGFRLQGNRLSIHPRIPRAWPGFELKYRYLQSVYQINVRRVAAVEDRSSAHTVITVDGHTLEGETIALVNDGKGHEVVIELNE